MRIPAAIEALQHVLAGHNLTLAAITVASRHGPHAAADIVRRAIIEDAALIVDPTLTETPMTFCGTRIIPADGLVMDGRYYARKRSVIRRPLQTKTGISMGFAVCELCDGVSEDGAQEIADALNAAEDLRQSAAAIEINRNTHEA